MHLTSVGDEEEIETIKYLLCYFGNRFGADPDDLAQVSMGNMRKIIDSTGWLVNEPLGIRKTMNYFNIDATLFQKGIIRDQ